MGRRFLMFHVKHMNIQADLSAWRGGSEGIMYRVYRVLRDDNGNIVHKTPVGCARSERGARALIAGQWGECVIEKM